MILDAAAGNRTMWQHKNSDLIVYIDIERKLEVKPTIFADNTTTPFLDNSFDDIFYDPPHGWDIKGRVWIIHASKDDAPKKHAHPYGGAYYGWDKYHSRQELIRHIYSALKEFYRILKHDGLLWFKWNETRIPLNRFINIFDDWNILMKLKLNPDIHAKGEAATFWICLCKKKRRDVQSRLS